jgi:steroid delta-isomerase-like uncharacterized protein
VSTDQNKALVRRFYDAIDGGDLAALDQFVADDYIDHNPGAPGLAPGIAGLRQFFTISLNGFSAFRHTIDDQIAEGDKVVTRLTATGVHSGDIFGFPATGKRVAMTSIVVHRIADGMLAEHWSQSDNLGLLQQLGVLPVMTPPAAQARA